MINSIMKGKDIRKGSDDSPAEISSGLVEHFILDNVEFIEPSYQNGAAECWVRLGGSRMRNTRMPAIGTKYVCRACDALPCTFWL